MIETIKAAITRCDQCDNGIEEGWNYCAWCGMGIDNWSVLGQRAADEIEELKLDRNAHLQQAERVCAERDRFRAALKECAADWSSPPTTVMGAVSPVIREFKRRMQIATDALGDDR